MIDRCRSWAAAAVAIALFSGAPAAGGAEHPPGQERVPDFGRLVPPHEVDDRPAAEVVLERVTSAVPWGRGMAIVDGALVVLSRGRHRGDGGVDQGFVDRAGTLWRVDTSVSERVVPGAAAGEAVRRNATVFAEPTSPPFHLYTYERPAAQDVLMARPYCALAYDEPSRNLFVCAYSGAELPAGFRKHATDAVYRYDLRDRAWHVVEQHDPRVVPRAALGPVVPNEHYPHHDPAANPPPHGWTNGPDGCVAVGRHLYVPAKDNHVVVQYDLDAIRRDPRAGPPPGRPVLGPTMIVRHPGGAAPMEVLGPSAVAHLADGAGGHLYVGYRTSSIVLRVPLDAEGDVVRGADGAVTGDLVAVFEPWDADRKRSGNLYDIATSRAGDLYVSMGSAGRIWRLRPDPERPFYGNDRTDRPTTAPPFLDMTALVGRTSGCNNIFVDDAGGFLYVSSRNDDTGEGRLRGTIYRVRLGDRGPRRADG